MSFSSSMLGLPDSAVAIVGLGACTSIGRSWAASAAAARAGINRFRERHTIFDRGGEPVISAEASYLGNLEGESRWLALLLPALYEATADFVKHPPAARRRPLPWRLALPAERPGASNALARRIDSALQGFKHPSIDGALLASGHCLAHGHAAGLMALKEGLRIVSAGDDELCLIGGCDSYYSPEALTWLDQQEQLKSNLNPWGFIPGEAAAFCLLASSSMVRRAGWPVLAWVMSAATSQEKNINKTQSVCLGKGLTQAVSQVIVQGADGALLDHVYCDLNGERYRADEWGFTLARIASRLADPTGFTTPADCWGDTGAASGPLLIVLACAAGQRGYARGPLALLWSSSDVGWRSAAILHTPLKPKCAGTGYT